MTASEWAGLQASIQETYYRNLTCFGCDQANGWAAAEALRAGRRGRRELHPCMPVVDELVR